MPNDSPAVAETPRRAGVRARLGARLRTLLFSSRPRWAMMPGYVAENFAESLLFTLAALERAGVEYVVHYGTLLGAARLGGVCPWDEDADIFVIDEDADSLERKVRSLLEPHGFDLIPDPTGFFWVRQRPWWAGQGHIGIEFLPRPDAAPPSAWSPVIPEHELRPLRRYPFHGGSVWGPALADPVLARYYGETAAPEVMARFRAPRISSETEAFWREAKGPGLPDWTRISERFARRREERPFAHLRTFPWWWFNGAYNIGIGKLRRLGNAWVGASE